MSVQIQTINLEKRLVLSNDSVGAVMAIGNKWTSIRLWMRMHLGELGVSPGLGPLFRLGVMTAPTSNMSNGPNSATTGHFIGIDSGPGTWVRAAGPPVHYTGVQMRAVKKILTGVTATSANVTLASADPSRRLCYGLSIIKGAPNYTFRYVFPNSGAWANALLDIDVNAAMFENIAMQISTAESRNLLHVINGAGSGYTNSINRTIAVNESVDGVLDSLCVSWNRTDFDMQISDLVAAVIQ